MMCLTIFMPKALSYTCWIKPTDPGLHHLQWVQNATARLITGTKRHDHTPVRFQIDFQIVSLTFKDLNCLAPKYITDILTWYMHSWPLRSLDGALLVTPRSHFVTNGDRAFSIRASTLGTRCLLNSDTLSLELL